MENKTIGMRFAESEAYLNMRAHKRQESDAFEVGSSHYGEQKDLSTVEAEGGALVVPTRVPGIVAPPDRRLFLRDLLPAQQSNGIIEYVEETGFVNNAAPVAEGALKPDSNLTFDLVQLTAKVIAHTLTASRQILSDAPTLRSYVDGRMVYGIKFKEEAQMLYGTGTGENLQGLLTHPSRQTVNWSSMPSGTTQLDAIRRALALVTLAEYSASGVVVHPNDKTDIDLLKGDDKHYLLADAGAGQIPAYWRVPIVETAAIAEGETATGAFNLAARIHDVWDASVKLYEQHADYAKRNKVLVLGEERLALANERPEAIVHLTLNAPPA